MSKEKRLQKPEWLRVRIGHGPEFKRMGAVIHGNGLHTVCEEALCPNMGECWCKGHATVMILGGECTRGCKFCNVVGVKGSGMVDEDEPCRVARAVSEAGLKEVVLTSVTRDDLKDGGARIWAETVCSVREAAPEALVEVLVPDFGGDWGAAGVVFDSRPDVFGHNLETVPSLYEKVRPEADYQRSLELLRKGADSGLITKTSIMVGLGETHKEVGDLMRDARSAGCSIFFVGHYLQPSKEHCAVERYLEPEEFEDFRSSALEMGFPVVVSSPLVRSSYHSDDQTEYVRSELGHGAG